MVTDRHRSGIEKLCKGVFACPALRQRQCFRMQETDTVARDARRYSSESLPTPLAASERFSLYNASC